jgi:cysteine synthase A/argininosuccinate lyase
VVPADLAAPVWQRCADLVRHALAAIGYDFGAAHVELRVTADGPKLIEINCRPAGDRITHLVTVATGVDLIVGLIGMHLGHPPRIEPDHDRSAAIVFLRSHEGVVRDIDGVAEARGMPGVREVGLYVDLGTAVVAVDSNTDRVGHVIAVGADPDSALGQAQAAAHRIQVEFQPDRDAALA